MNINKKQVLCLILVTALFIYAMIMRDGSILMLCMFAISIGCLLFFWVFKTRKTRKEPLNLAEDCNEPVKTETATPQVPMVAPLKTGSVTTFDETLNMCAQQALRNGNFNVDVEADYKNGKWTATKAHLSISSHKEEKQTRKEEKPKPIQPQTPQITERPIED